MTESQEPKPENKSNAETGTITFEIDIDQSKQFKAKCILKGEKIKDVLNRFIDNYLK